jgi:hypothetical protein
VQCRKRLDARLRGHDETIGERLERDLVALLPLPATASMPATSMRPGSVLSHWSGTGPTTTLCRRPTVIGTCWSVAMYTR